MLHGSHGVVIQITGRAFAGYLPDGHCISGTISGMPAVERYNRFVKLGREFWELNPASEANIRGWA
jgi:hypothetical protein